MIATFRAALVIARRDYVATVWSKAFLLFLIGPLFPIVFGVLFGAISANVDRAPQRPVVALIDDAVAAKPITDARAALVRRLGEDALPLLRPIAPDGRRDQPARLLTAKAGVAAVLDGGMDRPRLHGPADRIAQLDGGLSLILDQARQRRVAGAVPEPVRIARETIAPPPAPDRDGGMMVARGGQLVLVMLTMILAGMLLSNLIEEKSNKVIEVLAAAVPVDAIFLGKLIAMLGMSFTGIAVWGGTAALGLALFVPGMAAALPVPAIGWPGFMLMGVVYFTASYLLLGALFLGIGAQASSVREVQTLSMPVTMGQLVVFAFASAGIGAPGGRLSIAASLFPWSSPFAMLARAAEDTTLWPHLAAVLWQAMWVAIIIRVAARRFRTGVLKSGGRRGWFGRR